MQGNIYEKVFLQYYEKVWFFILKNVDPLTVACIDFLVTMFDINSLVTSNAVKVFQSVNKRLVCKTDRNNQQDATV